MRIAATLVSVGLSVCLGTLAAAEAQPGKKAMMKPVMLISPEDFQNPKAFVKEGDLLLVKGRGVFFSAKTIDVDPAGNYHFSVEYRTRSGSPVKILTGFVPLDGNGKAISAKTVGRITGTETETVVEAYRGEKILRVKDASGWKVNLSDGYVAFDAKADLSDLPNPSVFPMVKNGVEKEGNVWKITLKNPLQKNIPAGMKVRQHSGGGAYIWNPVRDYQQGKWILRCSKLIGPAGKPDKARYSVWPGMKKARFVLLVNGKADSVTEIRNVKIEEVR